MKKLFKKYNILLDNKQVEQFENYYKLLIEENKKYNITSITDYEQVTIKHFLDSAVVINYFDFDKVNTVCDIGSGGGFPLVPIKILYPHLKIFLVDSLNKRVNFLKILSNSLKLQNCICIHDRAETFGHSDYREYFDVTINRAVSKVSVVSEYCLPITKIGGTMILLKSNEIDDELANGQNSIKLLGGKVKQVIKDINVENNKRSIVLVEKQLKTNKKFPRKAGKPSKSPL